MVGDRALPSAERPIDHLTEGKRGDAKLRGGVVRDSALCVARSRPPDTDRIELDFAADLPPSVNCENAGIAVLNPVVTGQISINQ